MQWLLERVEKEGAVIRGAPGSFAILAFTLAVGAWFGAAAYYRERIEAKQAQCESVQAKCDAIATQVAQLRERNEWLERSAGTKPPEVSAAAPSVAAPLTAPTINWYDNAPSGSTAGVATQERIYVQMTPAQLTSNFDGRTSAQGDAAVAMYIGKWIRMSATVDDVSVRAFETEVTLDASGANVHAYFEPSWSERLAVLPLGAPIAIRGRIGSVGYASVGLELCELAD